MEIEDLIKKFWPSALEGDMQHPDIGTIKFWTGEDKGRIVVRFSFEGQANGESEKIFFITSKNRDWTLNQVSSFQETDSKLKLTKIQSFREYEELEKKYRSVIELFMKSRKSRKFF